MKKIFVLIALVLLLLGCTVSEGNPDLVILDLDYDEVSSTIAVRVSNEGLSSSGSFTVEAYDGPDFLGRADSVGLGKGGKITVTITDVSLPNGEHPVKAIVDPENLVFEFFEYNNEFEKTIMVGEEEQPPPNGDSNNSAEEIDLAKLIERGKNQENVHYVTDSKQEALDASDSSATFAQEVWSKGDSVKMVSTMNHPLFPEPIETTTISKGEFTYTKGGLAQSEYDWMASTTWAEMRCFTGGTVKYRAFDSPLAQLLKEIEIDPEATVTGKERIGTRETVVVEYIYTIPCFERQENRKAWIWLEKGIPLKSEYFGEFNKTTMQVIEIDFEPVDESLFEVIGSVGYPEPEYTYGNPTTYFPETEITLGSATQGTLIVSAYAADDPNKVPVKMPGAQVNIYSALGDLLATEISDAEGQTQILTLEEGAYNATISNTGYKEEEINIDINAGIRTNTTVYLQPT